MFKRLLRRALAKKTVLLIDDDEGVSRQVRYRLTHRDNLTVDSAANGTSGLVLALKNRPDLIILDWMLPDISGPEMLKTLKQDKKTSGIPILMFTGRNLIGDMEYAFRMGAESYLTKPFALSRLGNEVCRLLR